MAKKKAANQQGRVDRHGRRILSAGEKKKRRTMGSPAIETTPPEEPTPPIEEAVTDGK